MKKLANHRPKRILVMTEFVSQAIKVPLIKAYYTIERVYVNKVKSSFAYHKDTKRRIRYLMRSLSGRHPKYIDISFSK